MPKRIYTPDEYLKGLEEQNIVVFDAMRIQIKSMNAHGIVEGCYPTESATNPILPANDERYKAGHLDRKREAQQRLDDYHLMEKDMKPPGMSPQGLTMGVKGSAPIAPASIYGEGTLNEKESAAPIATIEVAITRAELAALIRSAACEGNMERVTKLVEFLK